MAWAEWSDVPPSTGTPRLGVLPLLVHVCVREHAHGAVYMHLGAEVTG